MSKLFLGKLRYAFAVVVMIMGTGQSFAQLEEITVTATRRVESLQDVPISISAFSGERIGELNIRDWDDISAYIPNFEMNSASIIPNLYVRGLGGGLTHSIEQSVGRFVDDVYIGRAAINTHGFFDMAGVELLRGPQGTLFGKNTIAGAMIMRSAQPTDTFESGLTAQVGSYETTGGNTQIEGYVSGPLGDSLNGRLAARYRDHEGYYINNLDGPDGPQREDWSVRGILEWAASDTFTANLKMEYQTYDTLGSDTGYTPTYTGNLARVTTFFSPNFTPGVEDWRINQQCTEQFQDLTPGPPGPGPGGAPDNDVSVGVFCPSRESNTSNITLNLSWDMEAGTLRSISALQEYDYAHKFSAFDNGISSSFRAQRDEDFSGFSQEFRFTSEVGDSFDYIAGVYYENSDLARDQTSDFNFTQNPGVGFFTGRNENWSQDTETLAAYGQVRWHFNEAWSATLGGRYGTEDKSFQFERFFRIYGTDQRRVGPGPQPGGPALVQMGDRSEDKFTFSANLQWNATDNSMFYATFAQGNKTGGFSDRIDSPNAEFEFGPEDSDTFEIGTKLTSSDGAVAFNAAIFYMDITGLQAASSVVDPVTGVNVFTVKNAAEVTSQGVELDLAWNVNEWLTLGGNFAYTDATYDDFPGSPTCAPGVVPDPDGTCNLAGYPLTFAPENKGMAYADMYFDDALGEWDLSLHADVTYSSEAWTDLEYDPDGNYSRSHTLWNAYVRMISPDQKYTIGLLGRNIGNTAYCTWCLVGGPSTLNPPREIQLTFTGRWGNN